MCYIYIMRDIGLTIYEQRKRQELSQAQLAQRIGIAQANLSNIEKGKRDFTVSMLLRIAKALGMKPAELLDDESKEEDRLELTRNKIEQLAHVIIDPKTRSSSSLTELARQFRKIIPEAHERVSQRQAELAWANLRSRFSAQEIKSVCARVEDARQRTL